MKKILQNRIAFVVIVMFLFVTEVNAQKPTLMIQVSTGYAQSITYSPDESKLFSVAGGTEKTGILWDVFSGKQLHIFKNVMAGCFSKDGKTLIIFSDNKVFKILDFMGNELKVLSQTVNPVYFNSGTIYPEPGVMLTTDKIINIYTGEITIMKGDGFRSRDYGASKNIVALGSENGKVTICNSKNGQLLENITIPMVLSFDYASSLSFSKDNNLLLAASSGSEGTISIYSFLKKDFISSFKYPYSFYAVSLSPDGKNFVMVGSKITMADTKTGKIIWEKENSNGFKVAFFNGKGSKVILNGNGALAVVNYDNGTTLKDFKILPVGDIAGSFKLIANDSKLIYRPTESKVVQWDFIKGLMEKQYIINQHMDFNVPTTDGTKIFTLKQNGEQKDLVEYDLTANATPYTYLNSGHKEGLNSLHLSYDNKYIILSTADNYLSKVSIWDTYTHTGLALNLPQDHQICAFAKTSDVLATTSNAKKNSKREPVQFYEIPSGKLLNTLTLEGTDFVADDLAYSNTDKYLLARQQNNLSLIDIEKRSIQTIPNPDSSLIGLSHAFTPDDKYFVKGTNKGNIEFYNIANKQWESAKAINAHKQPIRGIDFSKNGLYMFTASMDNTIRVWNWETKKLLATLYSFPKTNDWAVLTPDGHFDATPGAQENMYYVKDVNTITLADMYENFFTPHLLPRILNGENINSADVDIDNIHVRPIIKIQYAEKARNLEVGDDNPVYANTTGLAELTINATAPEDKVDEIRLFHNGKIVNLATRGLFVTDEKTGNETKKYTISLLPGQNTFRAVALNGQRTESKADEISVNYKTGNSAPDNKPVQNNSAVTVDAIDKTATLYLVVIGINKYQNEKLSLNYALADATAFKDEIEKDAKTVLGNVKTYFVTDNTADKKRITDALNEVQKNAKPQDVFVFYYAGHGYISEKTKEFYIVPTDVADIKNVDEELQQKGISSKMLQTYAINIPAQKQIFILDACQSAGVFEALLTADANQQKSLALVSRSTGTHWMAASGSKQYAQEFATLKHGAFTYVLLQALQGQAAANKMITVNGLKIFMQVQVPELMKKYNSAPQYPASYGLGNDFPVELIK